MRLRAASPIDGTRVRNAFQWGDRDDFAHAKSRGSPFQMPTRLADGLGPESDRDDGSPPP